MGACESDRNKGDYIVNIQDPIDVTDATKFYDVIIPIQSIKDITKGWEIKISDRFRSNYKNLINQKALKIGIIGNSNKGKSFILSKLSKINLPTGTSIRTEGLSIKYPDLLQYPDRRIVLLDSAGLETPVLADGVNIENIESLENVNQSNQGNNLNNDEKTIIDLFKEKSKEKIITELFLQDYIIYNSDILIVVVGILTYSEQKILNKIKTKLKREKSFIKSYNNLFIIHNLMTFTTVQQVETYINQTLLKSSTFQLEKNMKITTKIGGQTGVCYYEKNSNPRIFHLIFANEYSEAGRYYNDYTLSFIEKSFELNTDLKGFDIVETVKERFKIESKDIIELPQNEEIIFYENSKTLIKLQSPKTLTLKKFFIDELGFQNMKAKGFEPNYSYYKTNDAIVINIEVPGKCYLESSLQYTGEYTIIKINGRKEKDVNIDMENNYIYKGREFGKFSLDIPIKQEDFVIKNERPLFYSENGIIVLTYKIEKILNTVSFGTGKR